MILKTKLKLALAQNQTQKLNNQVDVSSMEQRIANTDVLIQQKDLLIEGLQEEFKLQIQAKKRVNEEITKERDLLRQRIIKIEQF